MLLRFKTVRPRGGRGAQKLRRTRCDRQNFGDHRARGGVNIAVDEYVPVATVGTQLAPDFVISERNIRGAVSRGMICSRTELGLPRGNEPEHGIWLLGEKFADKLGQKVRDLC